MRSGDTYAQAPSARGPAHGQLARRGDRARRRVAVRAILVRRGRGGRTPPAPPYGRGSARRGASPRSSSYARPRLHPRFAVLQPPRPRRRSSSGLHAPPRPPPRVPVRMGDAVAPVRRSGRTRSRARPPGPRTRTTVAPGSPARDAGRRTERCRSTRLDPRDVGAEHRLHDQHVVALRHHHVGQGAPPGGEEGGEERRRCPVAAVLEERVHVLGLSLSGARRRERSDASVHPAGARGRGGGRDPAWPLGETERQRTRAPPPDPGRGALGGVRNSLPPTGTTRSPPPAPEPATDRRGRPRRKMRAFRARTGRWRGDTRGAGPASQGAAGPSLPTRPVRRSRGSTQASAKASSSLPWMPPKAPLDITRTTSPPWRVGTRWRTISSAAGM
jgi:hypothetical protein